MKTKLNTGLIFLVLFQFLLLNPAFAVNQSVDEFITEIQEALESKDIEAYLNCFYGNIRQQARIDITEMFENLKMEKAMIFKCYSEQKKNDNANVYLRVLFENSYSVIIKVWNLGLKKEDGRWKIMKKGIIGETKNLYKINIPFERAERVKSVEIKHVDIKISFKDAVVFYDNIPGLETALLVIGKGNLDFSPSLPRERHQLELLYKNNFIKDKLEYVYLRFSPSFFVNNIRIEKDEGNKHLVTQEEKSMAYSLFVKHYSRSFTTENSLNSELLSFLPGGDEAVFEFEGKKIGNFSYIYSPFSEEEVHFFQWKNDKIINLYSPSEGSIKKKLFISFVQIFDVKNYQIDVNYHPKEYYFSAKAKIEIDPLVDSLDLIKFRLNPDLEILRINDENKHELFYTRDRLRKLIYVYLFQLKDKKKPFSIEVYYRGKIAPSKKIDDTLPLYQMNDGTLRRMPRFETDIYTRKTYWYPVPPGEDYSCARLKIIIPPGYSCVSNGKLVEQYRLKDLENVEDIKNVGFQVYVFEAKKPIKYLAFVVGKFLKKNESAEPIPIKFFKDLGIRTKKWDVFEEAKRICQFYESKFGPFPFEKLSIVSVPWTQTGGISTSSFIVLNELPQFSGNRRVISTNSPVNLSRWREFFLAHEIAHQWWGQAVSWDTYHDQWISEGLAQFAAVLYLKDKYGETILPYILKKFSNWTRKKAKWGSITMGSRISHFDYEAYQAIIYDKTSLILNMLKDYLGEDLFFKGFREFFSRHKYSAARSNDLFKIFKEVSGKDLNEFFIKWFHSYSLPTVNVLHSIQEEDEGYLLKFKIVQSKDLFIFPLWVEWQQKGTKVRKQIFVNKKVIEVSFKLGEKPRNIKINPDKAVPGYF